jgi:UDP-glucose:(heptosyl)LPS alpha-1,3-glucosyltransferase
MKIALCLFKYFPYGGLQRDFLQLAILLCQKHQVEIFTTAWEGEIPEDLLIHTLSVSGLTNHKRMLDFARKAIARVEELHFDCVVGFNKLPGVDVYFAADNCYVAQSREKHGFFYRLTSRYRTYAMLEKMLFCSPKAPKILALAYQQKINYQKIYRMPDEQFFILPPDFPLNADIPNKDKVQKIRQRYEIKENEYLVLMVCSAFKTKGVDRALKALKKLPTLVFEKTHLLIIGDDDSHHFLQLAKKLQVDVRVKFLGGRKNVLDYMFAADLLLHPAYQEAAGKVLLEAMSCGLPVLTTACCGYAEHIEKAKAGVVLPYKFSNTELANALFYMLSSTQKEAWKNGALDYVARYPRASLISEAARNIEVFGCV